MQLQAAPPFKAGRNDPNTVTWFGYVSSWSCMRLSTLDYASLLENVGSQFLSLWQAKRESSPFGLPRNMGFPTALRNGAHSAGETRQMDLRRSGLDFVTGASPVLPRRPWGFRSDKHRTEYIKDSDS
jgi:hypothetical protein